jgi:predicted O-linked N-acetylglucosamine transferase (SPINDLY family)
MPTIPETIQAAFQHYQAGRLAEAETLYRQVLQAQPDNSDALHLLGLIAHHIGRHEVAVEMIGKAIAINPSVAAFHNNIGEAYRAQLKLEEATVHYLQALSLKPDFAEACNNLGTVYQRQGRLEEAAAYYRQALKCSPGFALAYNNLGALLCYQGNQEEAAACFRQALAISPDNAGCHSNLLYALCHYTDDAAMIAQECRQWNELHARPLARLMRSHPNDRSTKRRLRVGYVSADFCNHPIGFWMEPLLAFHQRAEFEVVGYYDGGRIDETTRRLQPSFDVWHGIVGLSDDAVAELIRNDRIDILVDLSGHVGGNRLLVFARKPAPVQVTYLGSLTTTSLTAMDYRLTDRFLSPENSPEWSSETLIRLPACFACYHPPRGIPDVAPLPSAKTKHVTFASFNNLAKVTQKMAVLWADILHAVPESRLVLKDRALVDMKRRDRLCELFNSHGIDERRLDLLPATLFPAHLEEYGRVDIALDPFPYNGCYTSCEALWMGVPLVTLAGSMTYSRYGVSLLSNLDLGQLIAATPEEYVTIAVKLAKNSQELAGLRTELRARMAASPLCDAKLLAHAIEEAYRDMWRRWCRS